MVFPNFIEPKELAKSAARLSASLPLASFERITDLLLERVGVLHLSWAFEFDVRGQVLSQLDMEALLVLPCQRCQAAFNYPLKTSIFMKLVRNEQEAEHLALDISPLYVDAEGRCQTLPLIEDELILSLPDFPMHEKNDCSYQQNQAYYVTSSNDVISTYKPFAQLKEKK